MKVFDRINMVWRTPSEMQRVREEWNERAFQRLRNQGELACPMIIRDGMDPVQSMLDGRHYDSKSNLRRTYKAGGVEEVGNDPAYTDPERVRPKQRPKPDRKGIYEAVQRGLSLANLTTSTPGDDIRITDWTPDPRPQKLHTMKG